MCDSAQTSDGAAPRSAGVANPDAAMPNALLQRLPLPDPAWTEWREATERDWPAGFEAALAVLRQRSEQAHDARELGELLREALGQLEQLTHQLRAGQLRDTHNRRLADQDGLTALLNRGAFHRTLSEALRPYVGTRTAPPLTLMMLDLDHFKAINDRHGHAAGDAVLRIAAARMRHAVRAGDVLGRLGGDEFACLVPEAHDRAQLSALARKLRRVIAATMVVDGQRLRVRASLGIAICPPDGASSELLLAHADAAMYRAKRSGEGQAFYSDDGAAPS